MRRAQPASSLRRRPPRCADRCQPAVHKGWTMSPLVIAITGAAVLVVLIIWFVLSRIQVAGPNQAFIITGRKTHSSLSADGTVIADLTGQKVVMGASVF